MIFLSFRDVKEKDWETCFEKIRLLIQEEYLKHDYLLDSPKLKSPEKEYFKRIIDLNGIIEPGKLFPRFQVIAVRT